MRKPAALFFIAVISLLLFSGATTATHTQAFASGPPPAAPAVAGCWNVVSSPNPGSYSFINGVATISQSDVWAVGYSDGYTLVEHWDGTSWNVVPSPSPGTSISKLNGVTAISMSDV